MTRGTRDRPPCPAPLAQPARPGRLRPALGTTMGASIEPGTGEFELLDLDLDCPEIVRRGAAAHVILQIGERRAKAIEPLVHEAPIAQCLGRFGQQQHQPLLQQRPPRLPLRLHRSQPRQKLAPPSRLPRLPRARPPARSDHCEVL